MKKTIFAAIIVIVLSVMAGATTVAAIVMGGMANSGAKGSDPIDSVRVQVAEFSSLAASSCVDVVFTQGAFPGYVEIKGPSSHLVDVELKVNKGVLNVGYKRGVTVGPPDVVKVYVTAPELRGLSVSSAAQVTVKGALRLSGALDVKAESAAKLSFGEISAERISLRAQTAASVYVLSLEATDVNVSASTASTVKLKGIVATTVNADATTAASIVLAGRCNGVEATSTSGANIKKRGLAVSALQVHKASDGGKRVRPQEL